ncbi:MAG: 6-phospho-beta-galactosidase, partial [Erysipelotrichaceae bacterium]|nr:6-phospho-beta-galactosidase [Erysipelotrichaceae bacterium]
MKFSNEFVFGAATAAYQCEGETLTHGKGKVAWDDYLKKQGRFLGDPASDFYHQYPLDLQLCNQFGIQGIRISIAWSRIFPEGKGSINQEGVDFYHAVFKECKKNKVEPFVTLHHFDTPDALHKKGDFLLDETIDAFVEYAKFCFEEYKDDVTYWFTFNEVWPVATSQYIEGTFPPGITYDITKAVKSMHGMMVAHARAVNWYKEKGYSGKIGIIQSLESRYPFDVNDPKDVAAAKKEDVLANQFLLDATFLGYYSEETLSIINELVKLNEGSFSYDEADIEVMKKAALVNDYLGLNMYSAQFVKHYEGENEIHHNGTGDKGTRKFKLRGVGEHIFIEGMPATDWDWLIYPKGLHDMLVRIKDQYPNYKAIYITENGMGYKDVYQENRVVMDDPRIDYIEDHLRSVGQAIE